MCRVVKDSRERIENARAFLFDFDGTLYPSSAGIERQIKKRFRFFAQRHLGISEIEVRNLLHLYRKEYRSSVLGLMEHHQVDPHQFYEEIYGGIDITHMTPRPGLKGALRELSQNAPLYILSNSNRSFVQRGLSHLGLRDYFTKICTVEDHGFIRKPHNEAYIATLEVIGSPAEEVCMFDDIASSLMAAKSLGFTTVLVWNGLREDAYLDLHTGEEHATIPDWCDDSARDIAQFIYTVILSPLHPGYRET